MGHELKAYMSNNNSVTDQHHFDVDPDPDPTFHFDPDPDLLVTLISASSLTL